MKYTIWYSTETFAKYIIQNTDLKHKSFEIQKLYESDANNPNNFHCLPDHLKQILYLDAPDLIVELNSEPIFSIELSAEAGTGHNVFQRFARLAASVENGVPSFYIYPEAVIIKRKNSTPNWDKINPLIFDALDKVMGIYKIPALLYYFPSDFKSHPEASTSPNCKRNKGLRYEPVDRFSACPDSNHSEMKALFEAINTVFQVVEEKGVMDGRPALINKRIISTRKSFMAREFIEKGGSDQLSPISATIKIPTAYLINFLERYRDMKAPVGQLLSARAETIIYKVDAKFRGDPYPGALAALDYLLCREGKTFEERCFNLVLSWGDVLVDKKQKTIEVRNEKSSVADFVKAVRNSEMHNLLGKDFRELSKRDIPRYYMQVRYGSTFSKAKHIRVYSYFADAVIFKDGALWREA